MAATFGVHCLPHVWDRGIATAASLHVLATLPPSPPSAHPSPPYNDPLLEWDSNPHPLRTDLLTKSFALEDGAIRVPTAPGLGVGGGADEDVLRRHLVGARVVE